MAVLQFIPETLSSFLIFHNYKWYGSEAVMHVPLARTDLK